MTTSIEQLRSHLMDTLADLRNKETPMEPDRARAIAQVAGVLVDTARVEVDFIKATDGEGSGFIPTRPRLPEPPKEGEVLPGVTSRVHRIGGAR
jgi:hypothetical protein